MINLNSDKIVNSNNNFITEDDLIQYNDKFNDISQTEYDGAEYDGPYIAGSIYPEASTK